MDQGVTIEVLKMCGGMAGLGVAVLRLIEWRSSKRPRPMFEGLSLKNGELAAAIQQARKEVEIREVILNLAKNVHSLELRQLAFEEEIRGALRNTQTL